MEFYNSKDVKTKKKHFCFLCGLNIPPGNTVFYESGKFDGEFFSRYSHGECAKIWMNENKDGNGYLDEWGDFMEESTREEIETHKQTMIEKYGV